MRAAVFALALAALAACDDHGKSPGMGDGPPPPIDSHIDTRFVDYDHCDVAAGTANITFKRPSGTLAFHRVYAGGESGSGLVRRHYPGAPTPESAPQLGQTVILLFTDDEIRDTSAELACMQPGAGCTGAAVVVRTPERVDPFSAPGTHAVSGADAANTVQLDGSIAIDLFESPLSGQPGRISGTVSAMSSDGTTTVSGTYDNAFCPGLLMFLI
jgi:hypothetical protein